MFRFVYPWVLLALLIPLASIFFRKGEGLPWLRFPLTSRLAPLFRRGDGLWMKIPPVLLQVAILCLILGLARPQWGRSETEVTSEGIDIMLTVDASGSMAAMDFKLDGQAVDRLTVVKKVVSDFIGRQKGDRIGMVIFGSQAYTQCPLTLDYDVLTQLLDQLEIGVAGDATAIGDGLALAVKRLKDQPGKSKVIILLTDGRSNSGAIAPEKAAEIAKTLGVKVYTIGIGTKGPVPFPQPGIFGKRLVYVNLDLDEETLQKIAVATGGKYFFATDTEKLEEIYREIGRLEKTKVKVKHYEVFEEWYLYFAFAGAALLLLELWLSATWLRRLA
ncbi:MAG TPA: aerotolerance regulator BatA [Deltaproteobacteria bacterium]|nr:aerotolerance regulator BatA [Deltaproteobacteria bacterium]